MDEPEVAVRKNRADEARDHLNEIIGKSVVDRLVGEAGLYELNYLITAILDLRYPADIFGDGKIVQPAWLDDHGGESFDPGVKWVALLRLAVRQVPE